MGLPAEAILFVDDWPPHAGLTYLTDLHDLERLVTAAATLPPAPA
jgi:hypothetical protein